MDRRGFVASATAFVAAGITGCRQDSFISPHPIVVAPLAPPSSAISDRVLFGAMITAPETASDVKVQDLLRRTSDVFAAAAFYWNVSQPGVELFNFAPAEKAMELAKRFNQIVRGHTLVWYRGVPAWVDALSISQTNAVFVTHIDRVVSAFRGRVKYWDVVNEPIETKDGRNDGLRKSFWVDRCGAGYIDLAFRVAQWADPTALLGLNEYGLEFDSEASAAKRKAFLNLLDRLLAAGVPVDYVGIQGHLDGGDRFSEAGFGRFLQELQARKVRIMLTEFDVSDRFVVGTPAARDAVVRDTCKNYLDVVYASCTPTMVNTWGLTDRTSWLQSFGLRSDGTRLRPLPFDDALQPKPMWNTLLSFGLGTSRWAGSVG
jgi:endo-1,4-beta-xylanase